MLQGPLAHDRIITITDVDPRAFEILIRYLGRKVTCCNYTISVCLYGIDLVRHHILPIHIIPWITL